MPHYSATIEWLGERVGVLRLHPFPHQLVGDDYDWCCTVVEFAPGVAMLKGVCKPLPPGGERAIVRALRDEGFERRRYERKNRLTGKWRVVEKAN